ncbi:MAG: rod-binding protein [Clostridia bacterium]|nr:rod-binding protein [Clostridia bacterium]
MEIGGINNKYVDNSIESAKNKVSDDEFEKKLKSAMDKSDEKELRKVCQDFEGLMINMMYKQMKATVPKTDLLPSDTGKEIFEGMLDDKLVEESTKSRNVGLADILYKQLSRQMKSTYKSVQEGDKNSVEEK